MRSLILIALLAFSVRAAEKISTDTWLCGDTIVIKYDVFPHTEATSPKDEYGIIEIFGKKFTVKVTQVGVVKRFDYPAIIVPTPLGEEMETPWRIDLDANGVMKYSNLDPFKEYIPDGAGLANFTTQCSKQPEGGAQ